MLLCPCGRANIGQIKRTLKQQISEHITAVPPDNIDYAVVKHFTEANHGSLITFL